MLKNSPENFLYLKVTLEDSKKAWFVVEITDKVKGSILRRKIDFNESYSIRDYATVHFGGYEAEAPREILDYCNKQYGTEF